VRIALLLSTAFVTAKPGLPDVERRVQQYTSGLKQISEVVNSYPCFDVFSMDNTVEHAEALDSRLTAALDNIPTLKRKYHFLDNETGKINKGSGLVLQWNRILPDLLGKYEYVVHYEPRQTLVDFSFFERMASHPDAYICEYRDQQRLYGVPLTLPRFWTGFFSMRTSDLLDYVRAADRGVSTSIEFYRQWRLNRILRRRLLPGWAAELKECIESDLPRYVKRHKIAYVRVPALGARWHQEANNEWVDMVDRDFVG
jgi:hypothetical protein